MGVYGDLEAVFSYVTPRADCVADDGDVVVCHVAEGGAESQVGWLIVWIGSVRCEKGRWIVLQEMWKKRQMLCLEILWNWMDGFA